MRAARLAFSGILTAAAVMGGLLSSALAQGAASGPGRAATVTLEVADWLTLWEKNTGGWGLVEAGNPPGQWRAFSGTSATLSVPPGRYDAYWVQQSNIPPLLIAGGVDVRAAGATVTAATGVRLSVADWARLDTTADWLALRPGERTAVNQTTGSTMMLPVGNYDLYYRQGADTIYGTATFLTISPPYASLGLEVQAQPEGLKVVRTAPGSASEKAGVQGGDVITAVDGQNVVGMALAPAVAILRGPPSTTVKLNITRLGSTPLSITRDAQATIPTFRLDSGARLRLAPGQSAGFDPQSGWWGAYVTGEDPTKVSAINRSRNAVQPITLPPTTYDIYVRKDDKSDPVLLQKGVLVEAGKIAEVPVPR
jgi:hypothetical protein